jgi:hypothetical protein
MGAFHYKAGQRKKYGNENPPAFSSSVEINANSCHKKKVNIQYTLMRKYAAPYQQRAVDEDGCNNLAQKMLPFGV